ASTANEGESKIPLADVEGASKDASLTSTVTPPSSAAAANPPATSAAQGSSSQHTTTTTPEHPVSDRPLISYAYAESVSGRANFKYFLDQGLHGAADFIFIINGETDAADLIPQKPNIRVVRRNNTCFDLGAHGEVLRKDDLWKKYKRFITLNASIRGPFVPRWSKSCWSDNYLGRLTDKVKLVGMTINCGPQYHIQSMIFATDSVGMELMLYPPPGSSHPDPYGDEHDMVALQGCYTTMQKAIHGEVGTTGVIRQAGYEVEALMSAFTKSQRNYADECAEHPVADVLTTAATFTPYETIFMKANRDIDPVLINDLSDWHMNGAFPKAWDTCG
ncbi:uncharacterized protein PG998_000392, partial [Apiospora kogelbergensis]|uniref:uncharacterized protein n=1 Tax=Apiospora kogelbergensis TaxID=1337665 RepID=UPI00312E1A35